MNGPRPPDPERGPDSPPAPCADYRAGRIRCPLLVAPDGGIGPLWHFAAPFFSRLYSNRVQDYLDLLPEAERRRKWSEWHARRCALLKESV